MLSTLYPAAVGIVGGGMMLVRDRINRYLNTFVAERDHKIKVYQPYVDDPDADTSFWENEKEWYDEVIEMLGDLNDAVSDDPH